MVSELTGVLAPEWFNQLWWKFFHILFTKFPFIVRRVIAIYQKINLKTLSLSSRTSPFCPKSRYRKKNLRTTTGNLVENLWGKFHRNRLNCSGTTTPNSLKTLVYYTGWSYSGIDTKKIVLSNIPTKLCYLIIWLNQMMKFSSL